MTAATEAAVIAAVREQLAAAETALEAARRALHGTGGALTVRVIDPQITTALAAVDIAAVVARGDAARLEQHGWEG